MIFAKLDVCVWRHERFCDAGPAAAGYWMAALARLREDSSSDGYISPTVAGMLLKVGDRKAREFSQRLVDVGLFEAKGDGHVLLGYALKNETKEEIEARRLGTRSRVATHRAARRGNGSHGEHGNALQVDRKQAGNALQPAVTPLCVPGSDSDSGSVSDLDLRDLRSSPPAPPFQDSKGEAPSGTVLAGEVLRTDGGEPELNARRAKALADAARLAADPTFAAGGGR